MKGSTGAAALVLLVVVAGGFAYMRSRQPAPTLASADPPEPPPAPGGTPRVSTRQRRTAKALRGLEIGAAVIGGGVTGARGALER